MSCTPPVPVVVEYTVDQVDPSADVWSWNALPYAASQFSTTWLSEWVEPRSTCSHCGSLNALDQRDPVLPSVAFAAAVPGASVEDAVVGWPWDSSVPLPPPPPGALL